jgi:hypothetical protein
MDCARKIVEGSLAALTLVSRAVETRVAVSVGKDEATLIDDGEVVSDRVYTFCSSGVLM